MSSDMNVDRFQGWIPSLPRRRQSQLIYTERSRTITDMYELPANREGLAHFKKAFGYGRPADGETDAIAENLFQRAAEGKQVTFYSQANLLPPDDPPDAQIRRFDTDVLAVTIPSIGDAPPMWDKDARDYVTVEQELGLKRLAVECLYAAFDTFDHPKKPGARFFKIDINDLEVPVSDNAKFMGETENGWEPLLFDVIHKKQRLTGISLVETLTLPKDLHITKKNTLQRLDEQWDEIIRHHDQEESRLLRERESGLLSKSEYTVAMQNLQTDYILSEDELWNTKEKVADSWWRYKEELLAEPYTAREKRRFDKRLGAWEKDPNVTTAKIQKYNQPAIYGKFAKLVIFKSDEQRASES